MPSIEWSKICWFSFCEVWTRDTHGFAVNFVALPGIMGALWVAFLLGFMIYAIRDAMTQGARVVVRNPSRFARWAEGRDMKQIAAATSALVGLIIVFVVVV